MIETLRSPLLIGHSEVIWQKSRNLLKRFTKISVLVDDIEKTPSRWHDAEYELIKKSKNWQKIIKNHSLIVIEPCDLAKELFILSQNQNFLLNVIDCKELSNFSFASFVDKYPLTIAIGTENTAPVYATYIRGMLEATLPQKVSELCAFAGAYRDKVKKKFASISERRLFWQDFFASSISEYIDNDKLHQAHEFTENLLNKSKFTHEITYIYQDNPDNLTMGEFKHLKRADLVIFCEKMPEIENLCRREAEIIYGLDTSRLPFFHHKKIVICAPAHYINAPNFHHQPPQPILN